MDAHEVLRIIRILADGVDPYTGEKFPPESPYQNVSTVRALFAAAKFLEAAVKKERERGGRYERAGQPWTSDESHRLTSRYDQGASIPDLAKEHRRSVWAIRAQLMKLGKVVPEQEGPTA